jgi:hypothetical protein
MYFIAVKYKKQYNTNKKMIKQPPPKFADRNNLTIVKPSLTVVKPKNDIEELIEYVSDIDNYSKEEFRQGVEAHRWWLETLLVMGAEEDGSVDEIKEFMSKTSKTSIPFFLDKAVEQLEYNLKLKLDNICAVLDYVPIEFEYQLDNTFRIFNEESAIAIGHYENCLIIASEKYCHVIDTKKLSLEKIHNLFTNGKVNVFYKAAETLQLIRDRKILMTNNIFDVTSAYKLLWSELQEDDIDKKIDDQIGNFSDKDKAIKKTQYLLKVRLELRQQIVEKKLINEAKEVFKTLADSFIVSQDILKQANELKKMFDGVVIQPLRQVGNK